MRFQLDGILSCHVTDIQSALCLTCRSRDEDNDRIFGCVHDIVSWTLSLVVTWLNFNLIVMVQSKL